MERNKDSDGYHIVLTHVSQLHAFKEIIRKCGEMSIVAFCIEEKETSQRENHAGDQ